MFDLDLGDVDMDTVFEGFANLDDEFVASLRRVRFDHGSVKLLR